jgi:hypothetical protein
MPKNLRYIESLARSHTDTAIKTLTEINHDGPERAGPCAQRGCLNPGSIESLASIRSCS